MYINTTMRGAGTMLFALDGVLLGGVVEIDTVLGFVVRHARSPDGAFTTNVERVEGKVDYVGDRATDPDWMIEQRLVAIRHKLDLRPWPDAPARMEGVVPGLLEQLACRLRSGALSYVNIRQSRGGDRLPLPDGTDVHCLDGTGSLSVDFIDVSAQETYEATKAAWAAANPDMVPGYVRSRPEGAVTDPSEGPTPPA